MFLLNLTSYILCSAFMIEGRKLLTNAHCVEHDTQVISGVVKFSVDLLIEVSQLRCVNFQKLVAK